MNVSRLKLITFDVTNTLLKFRTAPGKQYGEIGALYGVLSDNNELAANFKMQWRKMNKDYPNFGLNSGLKWEDWWKMIIKGTFKDSIFHLDEAKLNKLSTHLIDLYKTSACWQPCFGSEGLLAYLKSKNIPLGVISNFDPRLSELLENTKMKQYFKFIITSYDIGAQKPEPKIFEEAMRASHISNLKPRDCLHIGDRTLVDYYGARNSKWNSFLISDKSEDDIKTKYPTINTNHIFSNLYDLHKYLIENNNDTVCVQSN